MSHGVRLLQLKDKCMGPFQSMEETPRLFRPRVGGGEKALLRKGLSLALAVMIVALGSGSIRSQQSKDPYVESLGAVDIAIDVLKRISPESDDIVYRKQLLECEDKYASAYRRIATLGPSERFDNWVQERGKRFAVVIAESRRIADMRKFSRISWVFPIFDANEWSLAIARHKLRYFSDGLVRFKKAHGVFPDQLEDLEDPLKGENGIMVERITKKAIDPWGRPYGYDKNGRRNAGGVPDVWTLGPPVKVRFGKVGNWDLENGE